MDDADRIRKLLELMEQHGLCELRLEDGDFKITLKKPSDEPSPSSTQVITLAQPGAIPALLSPTPSEIPAAAAAVAPGAATPGSGQLIEVRSPCVGTLYRSPTPEAEPFVEEGDDVEPDTTVCIIEAMKVMNEVKAERHGTVDKILVENGQPVEYDQLLMWIAP